VTDGHPGGKVPGLADTLAALAQRIARDRETLTDWFGDQWGFPVAWQELNWRWESEDYYFCRGAVCFVLRRNLTPAKTLSLWVGMVEPGEAPPSREEMERVNNGWHRISSREELAVRLSRAEEHGRLTLHP
jgi:hypothetical protein